MKGFEISSDCMLEKSANVIAKELMKGSFVIGCDYKNKQLILENVFHYTKQWKVSVSKCNETLLLFLGIISKPTEASFFKIVIFFVFREDIFGVNQLYLNFHLRNMPLV